MHEDDVRRVTASSSMVGSDGLPRDPNPHPRLWGTFHELLATIAVMSSFPNDHRDLQNDRHVSTTFFFKG